MRRAALLLAGFFGAGACASGTPTDLFARAKGRHGHDPRAEKPSYAVPGDVDRDEDPPGFKPRKLSGRVSVADVLAQGASWRRYRKSYEPDRAALAKLREAVRRAGDGVRALLIFGAWCRDSRINVPRALRVGESAALWLDIVSVDREYRDPEGVAAQHKVRKVPTVLVFEDGKELGRIEVDPKVSYEADLADLYERAGH